MCVEEAVDRYICKAVAFFSHLERPLLLQRDNGKRNQWVYITNPIHCRRPIQLQLCMWPGRWLALQVESRERSAGFLELDVVTARAIHYHPSVIGLCLSYAGLLRAE